VFPRLGGAGFLEYDQSVSTGFYGLAAVVMAVAMLAWSDRPASALPAPPALTVFSDNLGDSGSAPDIDKVTVTNDAFGLNQFHVTLASDFSSTSTLTLFIDADNNPQTGDPSNLGADFALEEYADNGELDFFVWQSAKWVNGLIDSGLTFRQSSDLRSVDLTVDSGDISNTPSFSFSVETTNTAQTANPVYWDYAPSGGEWSYTFKKPLSLSFGPTASSVDKAKRSWTLLGAVDRSDTGQSIGPESTVACSGTSGRTALQVVLHRIVFARLGAPLVAVCVFALPKKRAHLAAKMIVGDSGATVSRRFTATG
jgi:hypothetical protein